MTLHWEHSSSERRPGVTPAGARFTPGTGCTPGPRVLQGIAATQKIE